MRSLVTICFIFAAGCTGDLVELGPNGTTAHVDMAGGGGSGGSGGGGGTGGAGGSGGGGGGGGSGGAVDMAPVKPLTFTVDIQPDIIGTNATACMGQPCGCTNTGCHNAGNQPILSTTASTNYTNIKASTYMNMPVINTAMPAMSPLLQQLAPGGSHPGGQKFGGPTDPTYQKWLSWITQGAPQ